MHPEAEMEGGGQVMLVEIGHEAEDELGWQETNVERGDEVIRCMKCMVFRTVRTSEETVTMGATGPVGACRMKAFDVTEMEPYLRAG